MEQNIVVYYHADCLDGFGAAYAAWVRFGADAVYLPIKYGDNIDLKSVEGKIVFIVDFCTSLEAAKELLKVVKLLYILDHHKTSVETISSLTAYCEEENKGNFSFVHDETRSGCVITWDYLHNATAPMLLLYIQDRDLWKFRLEKTKAICLALFEIIDRDFGVWQTYCTSDNAMSVLHTIGANLLKAQENRVKKRVEEARLALFPTESGNYRVKVVNSTTDISEIGNELCRLFPEIDFAVVYYDDWNIQKNKVSLRSIGDFDVTVVAKDFDGGGHKNAAGFTSDDWYHELELL